MSTREGLKFLESIILGEPEETKGTHRYSIFLTGEKDENTLLPGYLIELLLIYDSGLYDIETISTLFDVSIEEVLLFTESYPGYGRGWEESIATKWTKFFNFYEEDLEDLAWLAKYAIKRADAALRMENTIIEATDEMAEELREEEGWTEETEFMRIEGIIEQEKRSKILRFWICRLELEGDLYGGKNSTAT